MVERQSLNDLDLGQAEQSAQASFPLSNPARRDNQFFPDRQGIHFSFLLKFLATSSSCFDDEHKLCIMHNKYFELLPLLSLLMYLQSCLENCFKTKNL